MSDTAQQVLQEEEWDIVESIYPDFVSRSETGTLKLEIPVEFPASRRFALSPADNHGSSMKLNLSLTVLPSVLLEVLLPLGYPSKQPPKILALRCLWMSSASRLHSVLSSMWNSNCVLYNWIEFLHNGEELLKTLGLLDVSGDFVSLYVDYPKSLSQLLLDNQSRHLEEQFSMRSYQCAICLSHVKGSKCIQLSCCDTFCRACLHDFWKLFIEEGDILKVACPGLQCVQNKRAISEEEVARVVTDSELRRWRWLRDKILMERDPTIVLCPLSFCQKPVPKVITNASDGQDRWDRLRTCSHCQYAFCELCRRTWHGPLTQCPISVSEQLVLDYLALPVTSEARDLLERKYGKSNILRLVANYEEEQLNKQLFESTTQPCPGCNVRVEKSLGCNHMTCFKCSTHFCYKCGTKIKAANPYAHFSTLGGTCFGQLFE